MADVQEEIEALRNEVSELRSMIVMSSMQDENDTFMCQNDDNLSVIGGIGGSSYPSAYDISSGTSLAAAGTLTNTYIIAGGKVMQGPGGNVYSSDYANKILCISCSMDYATLVLCAYSSIGEIQYQERSNRKVIVPLYQFGNVITDSESGEITGIEVVCDMRNMPFFDIWEIA